MKAVAIAYALRPQSTTERPLLVRVNIVGRAGPNITVAAIDQPNRTWSVDRTWPTHEAFLAWRQKHPDN